MGKSGDENSGGEKMLGPDSGLAYPLDSVCVREDRDEEKSDKTKNNKVDKVKIRLKCT